jgi:uncharacterized RmlC-like cupin family protein
MRATTSNGCETGVRLVRSDQLDFTIPQRAGTTRAVAIHHVSGDTNKLWAGMVTMLPNTHTHPHHHGNVEIVIYIVSGRLRMRWGDQLAYVADAGPGDFLYVPPYAPHQEINPSPDEACTCVIVRSAQEAIVVSLDITPDELPASVERAHPMPPQTRDVDQQ